MGLDHCAVPRVAARGRAGLSVPNFYEPAPTRNSRTKVAGSSIATDRERHGGPFEGGHGRYVLRTSLTLTAIRRADAAHRAA